jgi:ribosomal protein L40E
MGTFNTQKVIYGNPSLIPAIASRIESSFSAEGYTVQNQSLLSGSADISITKGGIFKAVLGMKTALKVTLKPQAGGILFDAGVGIFGQQVIPTVIMLFVAWPVLLTQIWGLVQQSKLDDKALAIAEEVVHSADTQTPRIAQMEPSGKFCTKCGNKLPEGAIFCPHCGNKQ